MAARARRRRPTLQARSSSSSRVQPAIALPDVDVAAVKAVLFDMDGVLCASEDISRQAATETMRELYGLEVDPDDFLPFTGTGEANFLGEREHASALLLLLRGRVRAEQFRTTLAPARRTFALQAAWLASTAPPLSWRRARQSSLRSTCRVMRCQVPSEGDARFGWHCWLCRCWVSWAPRVELPALCPLAVVQVRESGTKARESWWRPAALLG